MPGTLYLVATPIGNLEDITLRALRILKEADLIACEDTRHTRKLLSHFQISRPTISYHTHNERERTAEIISKLEEGSSVALVSDAGTPLISDPGFSLLSEAIARAIPVVPVPGPSALITAISASGLSAERFTFLGFLPSKRTARRATLAEVSESHSTLVFYEAPHRIRETLADALEVLGDRQCVLARELTKLHEQFTRGKLSEIEVPDSAERGEIVLLVGPPVEQRVMATVRSISHELDEIIQSEGLDQKAALKKIARARGISKSEAYRLMLAEKSDLKR